MAEPVRGFISDSTRWDGFTFRDDDIVIATPAKCGTTWTQRIVSLLVFDSPNLYAPMSRISPWLDMNTRKLDEVLADLDAQPHRRFIKSHLKYDLLPHHEGVTYITVGRDPRDAGISWSHHETNMKMDTLIAARASAVGLDDLPEVGGGEAPPPPPEDPTERLWAWIDGEGFENLVTHLTSYWEHRDDPGVVLLHYRDLERDLPGEMARLAGRLGIDLSRERIEELAPHARFDAMRADAEHTVPNSDLALWRDNLGFFHKGESGQWRALLSEDDLPRYEKRVAELCDPDLAHWLHTGTSQLPA